MPNEIQIQGMNIYDGSADELLRVPVANKKNCLTVERGRDKRILNVTYHDPILGPKTVPSSSIDVEKLHQIAQSKSVPIQDGELHLMHLYPDELRQLIPIQQERDILRNEVDIAKQYFEQNPSVDKLSRKEMGLSHSYLRGEDKQVIQLAHKQECRMVWSKDIPTQAVFKNLPENTKAAYVLVKSRNDSKYILYYLKKGGEESLVEIIDNVSSTRMFDPFILSNQGLSKDELSDISDNYFHHHHVDNDHLYGAGGFGRVKKSQAIHEVSNLDRATKIQALEKMEKVQSKMGGRTAQISLQQNEVAIAHDINAADKGHVIIKNKSYFHMNVLGGPLAKKIRSSSADEKLDFAIKLLIEVHRLHTGAASKQGKSYAHRDIKMDNVLIDSSGTLRLTDFGFATSNTQDKKGLLCGTLLYAPLDQTLIDSYLKPPTQFEEDADIVSEQSDGSEVSLVDESFSSYASSTLEGNNASEIPMVVTEKKADWKYNLMDRNHCLTENYLEDDKIATLRTIYCNSSAHKSGSIDSIFDQSAFKALPEPIQRLFNSSEIAPLLSPERRHETEGFFAAVLIAYKLNPNLSNKAYNTLFNMLRNDPIMQNEFMTQYTQQEQVAFDETVDEVSLDNKDVSQNEMNSIELDSEVSDEPIKLKKNDSERSLLQRMKQAFQSIRGKRYRSVSPGTDDLDEAESDTRNSKK